MTSVASGGLSPALETCDVVGRLMEHWGFSRNMGRVWTLLFLSPAPLTAAEIQDRLSVSAGATSTVLRDLIQWGVVRRVWVPGERKDHYAAETDIWRMISRVLEERERNRIVEATAALDKAASALDEAARKGRAEERDLAVFRRQRVDQLRDLCREAEAMLGVFLETHRVDARGLDKNLGD